MVNGNRPMAVIVCLIAGFASYLALGAGSWWLSAVAATAAIRTVWRSLSPLVLAMVGYLVICLVLAPALHHSATTTDESTVRGLAAMWIVAACIGGVCSRRRFAAKAVEASRGAEIAPAVILSLVSFGATLLLIRQGAFGLSAQLAGQSPPGLLGLLSQLGPAFAAGAFITALRLQRVSWSTRFVTLALVGVQAVILTFGGFRGAAPFYVVAILIASSRTRGDLRRFLGRSRAKRAFALLGAGAVVAVLFGMGVAARSQISQETGNGATSVSIDSVIARLDASTPLASAWDHRGSDAARAAFGVRQQAVAVIPRFLYPDKPIIDYGRRVAVTVYGSPAETRTSSTVTAFGDAVIGLGVAGAFAIAALYTAVADSAFRWLRARGSTLSAVVSVAVVLSAISIESAFLLNLISALRSVLAIVLLYRLVDALLGNYGPKGDLSSQSRPRGAREEQCLVGQ